MRVIIFRHYVYCLYIFYIIVGFDHIGSCFGWYLTLHAGCGIHQVNKRDSTLEEHKGV